VERRGVLFPSTVLFVSGVWIQGDVRRGFREVGQVESVGIDLFTVGGRRVKKLIRGFQSLIIEKVRGLVEEISAQLWV
jgi:hypothetical protein